MQVEDTGHANGPFWHSGQGLLPEWDLLAPERFAASPHGTLLALSVPILGSLIAEPLTALADTAFVARLGAEPLAALGVGTMVLSALFWAFSFLGVATQTRVAALHGSGLHNGGSQPGAARMCRVAVTLAALVGLGLAVVGVPLCRPVTTAMGASGTVASLAAEYLRYRLLGAPAMLVSFAAFGALRGAHDMKTPLWVAGGMNAVNLVLDPILIFGLAGVPALGVAGAAIASSISQWVGATWAVACAGRRLGRAKGFDWGLARGLLTAGIDLFLRAASLNVFLLLGTRKATLIGAGAGAVHQVVRSTWFFNALFLDSFAISAQSLVAFFLGTGDRHRARLAARVVCLWSCVAGAVLGITMFTLEPWVIDLYVPTASTALFCIPWRIAAATQPVSGLTFGTDGVHFGAADFSYLRNSVLTALVCGGYLILRTDPSSPSALNWVWVGFTVWTGVRAVAGLVRIWPGVGSTPLRGACSAPR